jgi:pyridoxine 5-phosphate synthase
MYANARSEASISRERERVTLAARLAARLGLHVHAGHGLTYANVGAVAAIPEMEELNIGHAIVSRALFTGMTQAVREMKERIASARSQPGA